LWMHEFARTVTDKHFLHKDNNILLLKQNYSNFTAKLF